MEDRLGYHFRAYGSDSDSEEEGELVCAVGNGGGILVLELTRGDSSLTNNPTTVCSIGNKSEAYCGHHG